MAYINNMEIANAHIIFRNFAGKKSGYNAEGNRNFNVIFTNPDEAYAYISEGWNLKLMDKRDPDEPDRWKMKVNVSYEHNPPTVQIIQDGRRITLDEQTVGCCDNLDFEVVSLYITPYKYVKMNGDSGVSAYLKSMVAKVREDPILAMYKDIPVAGQVEMPDLEPEIPY